MKQLLILLSLLLLHQNSFSQDIVSELTNESALKVFIDCNFCDMDYIRKNINYVDYVRDTRVAQVHVLTTTQRTGSGGTEYTFNFIGQLNFDNQNDTLSIMANPDATFDEKRALRTKFIKIGLMRYVAKTPMANSISIEYSGDADSTSTDETIDKWDYWVFRIGANGWSNGQESYQSMDVGGNFSANRVTKKWKFENSANFGYDESRFTIDTTIILNVNRNYNVNSSAIMGLNNHWSLGLIAAVRSSTYSNIVYSHRVHPAIEYNVFDYAHANTKQIRFQYRIGHNNFRYRDTTIFNLIEENVLNHRLSVAGEFTQKWGSLYFSATASQYLHDTSLKNLSLYSSLSWRITKGLSFRTSAGIDFIQDQITLPKGGASDIEILTQQRQLATQYSYWGRVGFSYTFGSIYNNIVNPRFWN